ncbi:MAG TPA: hypothetical protein VIK27_12555, partial [Candidatus Aquilonibacter sp.]
MNKRLLAVAVVPLLALGMLAAVLVHSTTVSAQQRVSLNAMSQNSSDWVMPAGDYANLRHSDLSQITTDNV